jgi:hypothetical protein
MTTAPDPGAPQEVDPETPIWRYMSLDRYLSMLYTKELWFTRVDCLEDPWEGQVSAPALDATNRLGMPLEVLRPILEKLRVLIFVHCWTMHAHESIGLWSSFVRSQPGVVIRSTAGRLDKVVAGHMEGGHVALVRYIDFDTSYAMDGFNKRLEFQSELEVRAAFYDFGQYVTMAQGTDRQELPQGQPVPVSLPDLITEVRVAPRTPAWLLSAVQDLTLRYGVEVPVRRSEFDRRPFGDQSQA